jgi:hypothetical protein
MMPKPPQTPLPSKQRSKPPRPQSGLARFGSAEAGEGLLNISTPQFVARCDLSIWEESHSYRFRSLSNGSLGAGDRVRLPLASLVLTFWIDLGVLRKSAVLSEPQ